MTLPLVHLIEDDPALRAALAFALQVEGFDVRGWDGGEGFLAGSHENGPACLIIDYMLPGMNGLELLARLRRGGMVHPAIIVTSNPPRRLRLQIETLGLKLVEKPLLCGELVEAIRAASAGLPAVTAAMA